MADRHVEAYRGFQLVVEGKDGDFRGVAWAGDGQGKAAEASGRSQLLVLSQLKKLIASPLVEHRAKQGLAQKHGDFLRSRGIDPGGLNVVRNRVSRTVGHRKAQCWNCGTQLDSTSDLECTGCKWIICTNSGACGHGHPEHGEKYLTKVQSAAAGWTIRKFDNEEDARALASREVDATYRRDLLGTSWIVQFRTINKAVIPNRSFKRSANGWPPCPRGAVCLSCASRARRPSAVARLTLR
jgi:hypothetical protein